MINDHIPIVHTLLWELTYPPPKGTFEDGFPFPQVGYVSSLDGTFVI